MKEQRSPLTESTHAAARPIAKTPSVAVDTKALLAESSAGNQRRVLWIDGVGGYQLIDKSEVTIGQAVSGNPNDIAIVGDLSRRACAIRRSGGDYLLTMFGQRDATGHVADATQLLSSVQTIELARVKLKFAKPNPLSATARLQLQSLHHFKPHVDGVLLLADSCIIGPTLNCHVVCPSWSQEILLFQQKGKWFFRASQQVEVDGSPTNGVFPMVAGMRIRGEDFSMSVE